MGLLDKFKDKAGELVQGAVQSAKDKVSDVTGVDVDRVTDVAGSVVDGADLSLIHI